MKKLFTLLLSLPIATFTFGQAITITAADMPIPTATSNLTTVTVGTIANPTVSTAATWDYSTHTGVPLSLAYLPETDAFFTSAGSDVHLNGQEKYLNSTMVYYYDAKIDFSSTGVYENGVDIPQQLYDISAMTGNAGDSLNIPAQRYIMDIPKKIIGFPMTANTSWSSVSRRYANFTLTLSAAGLVNAPSQHVYYTHRKDSIVGWGKMRVYTAAGPSIAYDVLMDKTYEYNIDSFFIGGAPAPAAILTGFGITQGQQNELFYKYLFFRKTSFMYLASFVYGTDNTYTNIYQFHYNNSVTTATSVNDIANNSYSTVIFPNPANGTDINFMITGRDLSVDKYCIIDLLGRVVKSGIADLKQNILHIPLNNELSAGKYILIVSNKGQKIASEEFCITQ
jgi:hypothetical protein